MILVERTRSACKRSRRIAHRKKGENVDLEFTREEVRSLSDMASASIVREVELKEAYERFIERASGSPGKPDAAFIRQFILRPSFMLKSSYREKLLTVVGALRNSLCWSNGPRGCSAHPIGRSRRPVNSPRARRS